MCLDWNFPKYWPSIINSSEKSYILSKTSTFMHRATSFLCVLSETNFVLGSDKHETVDLIHDAVVTDLPDWPGYNSIWSWWTIGWCPGLKDSGAIGVYWLIDAILAIYSLNVKCGWWWLCRIYVDKELAVKYFCNQTQTYLAR